MQQDQADLVPFVPGEADGWMTVERNPRILARKGQKGVAWRIPNDSQEEAQSRKKISKQPRQRKQKKNVAAMQQWKEPSKEDYDAPASMAPSNKHTPIIEIKSNESSWVAAVKSSGPNDGRPPRPSSSSLSGMPKPWHSHSKKQAGTSKKADKMDDVEGSGSILRGKLRLRKQLQSILYANVNQAVDELYYICEFDSELESATAALELMKGWCNNFQALVDTVRLQKEFESLTTSTVDMDLEESLETSVGGSTRKASVAWEIKKSSPSTLSGINQIIDSVLRRNANNTAVPAPQIVATLRPYDETFNGSTSSTAALPIYAGAEEISGEQSVLEETVFADEVAELSSPASPSDQVVIDELQLTSPTNKDINATTVLEMLRLDNTTSTGLWGDMMMSESESDEEEDVEVMVKAPPSPPRQSPEATRSLHAKLSSPERAKPTPSDAHQRLIQKHSLARINRERIQAEKREKLNTKNRQVITSKEQRESAKAELESNMQKRLDRAEEVRQEQLKLRQRSALSELDKVSEVSFINSLGQGAKAAALQKKLDDAMARRQDSLEEKLAKQRVTREKVQQTADELRSKMQKEIDARKAELEAKLRKAETLRNNKLQRAQEQQKKKDERVMERRRSLEREAEAAKEARRMLLEEREAKAQKIRHDQIQARIDKQRKEEEDAEMRRKAMEEDAQAELTAKKMEMQMRAERAQLNAERHIQARAANAELRVRSSLDGRPEGLERLLEAGGGSPKRKSPKRGSPKRGKQSESPSKNVECVGKVSAPMPKEGACVVEESAAATTKSKKKVDSKARKKIARKYKAKLASFWDRNPFCEEQEVISTETSSTFKAPDIKKFNRFFIDIVAAAGRESDASVLFRDLLHFSKKEPFHPTIAKSFRTSGAYAAVLAFCNRETAEKTPHIVVLAMRVIELAILDNMKNRIYFHASCSVDTSSGLLGFALSDALKWADPKGVNRDISEWNSQLLVHTLRTCAMAIDFSTPEASIPYEYRDSIVRLFALAGHIEKLGELFTLYETREKGNWGVQASKVLIEGLQFLRVIAGSVVRPNVELLATNTPHSLVDSSLGEVCISGLLSLLFSMTDDREAFQIDIAMKALDVMNTVARLDIRCFQKLLSSSSLQPQFYHVLNFLLEKSMHSTTTAGADILDSTDRLTRKALVLMGLYAVANKGNQESLNWGAQPTSLQKICSLPFRFFNSDTNKDYLFPTLIAVCFNNERNTSVVEQELSAEMLVEYMESKFAHEAARLSGDARKKTLEEDNKENETIETDKKMDTCANKYELEGGVIDSLSWGFVERFPRSLWSQATAFFQDLDL